MASNGSDGDGAGSDGEAAAPSLFDPRRVPREHCAFCGLHEPGTLVQCASSGRWFCNNTVVSNKYSCAVIHLRLSKSKSIRKAASGPLAGKEVSCSGCGTSNLLRLGRTAANTLTCHDCFVADPVGVPAAGETDGSLGWEPVVSSGGMLESWMVGKTTDPVLLARAWRPSIGQIGKLERLWKDDKQTSIWGLLRQEPPASKSLPPIPMTFESPLAYRAAFLPALDADMKQERRQARERPIPGVEIAWRADGTASLHLTDAQAKRAQCTVGHIVELVEEGKDKVIAGTIVQVSTSQNRHGEDVMLAMDNRLPGRARKGRCNVLSCWLEVPHRRRLKALARFAYGDCCMSPQVVDAILGMTLPGQLAEAAPQPLSAPGLDALNASQREAATMALTSFASTIQGPPGTGKTTTASTIVFHMARSGQSQGPVLVCAPSNVATDHLAERIALTGLTVRRLVAHSREARIPPSEAVAKMLVHREVQRRLPSEQARYRTHAGGGADRDAAAELKDLKRALTRKVIQEADVLCCTCSTAGSYALKGCRFSHVLLDEVTQAIEPELLIPLTRGAQQVVLVGDQKQLGPVIHSDRAAHAGLSRTLFTRLVDAGLPTCQLRVQYRMHPALSEFPSAKFYNRALQDGVTAEQRTSPQLAAYWPQPHLPMAFLPCYSPERPDEVGSGTVNSGQVDMVVRLVTSMVRRGVRGDAIGIVTFYQAQAVEVERAIDRSLAARALRNVQVATVDGFQGREKDFIILSTVRCNPARDVGFVRDERRLNVSITRAKRGMLVIGEPSTMSADENWHGLLSHMLLCRSVATLQADGSLAALSGLQLPQPIPVGTSLWGALRAEDAAAAAAAAGAAAAADGAASAPVRVTRADALAQMREMAQRQSRRRRQR